MNLIIYFEFFKMGLFTFGGGLATLPFLFEMADKYDWLNREMIANFLAIGQSSPGAIGVNIAAMTGFQYGGVFSGIIAALGLVSPAVIVISIVTKVLQSFKENKIVISIFSSLRPAAAGLLAAAFLVVSKIAFYNSDFSIWYEIIRFKEFILFSILFIFIMKLKKHPILYIAAGAAAGIVLGL
jgi:chromate transporter